MESMLLDEMLSPRLSSRLGEYDTYAIAIRDRGLLGKSDRTIWDYAQNHEHLLVTANPKDFVGFCRESKTHHGLLAIPGGRVFDEQLSSIIAAINFQKSNSMAYGFANCHVRVDVDYFVNCDLLTSN